MECMRIRIQVSKYDKDFERIIIKSINFFKKNKTNVSDPNFGSGSNILQNRIRILPRLKNLHTKKLYKKTFLKTNRRIQTIYSNPKQWGKNLFHQFGLNFRLPKKEETAPTQNNLLCYCTVVPAIISVRV